MGVSNSRGRELSQINDEILLAVYQKPTKLNNYSPKKCLQKTQAEFL